jgi:iron complex transport system substrate-binding protein
VNRIVSLSVGTTEILCAIGCEDKIVGRDAYSDFPESILSKPVVGSSAYSFSIETLLELEPDLVVSDTTLRSNSQALETIRNQNISVIIEDMGNSQRIKTLITNLGLILDKQTQAKELTDYLEHYENLVSERVGNIAQNEKPKVYVEWYEPWQSFSDGSPVDGILVKAGGANIAAGNSMAYPKLSPEFVVESNPDVIISLAVDMESAKNTAHWQNTFQNMKQELQTRTGLSDVNAIKNDKIYLFNFKLATGIRYPIELLYFAKWLYPNHFEDIDPGAVHAQLIQSFFDETLEGVYAYP